MCESGGLELQQTGIPTGRRDAKPEFRDHLPAWMPLLVDRASQAIRWRLAYYWKRYFSLSFQVCGSPSTQRCTMVLLAASCAPSCAPNG